MAKAQKKALPSTTPVESMAESASNPNPKAKMGDVSRGVIAEGVEKLQKAIAQLQAMAKVMQEDGLDSIQIEGPKLLPRGVNSVLQFALKLDVALRRRDRM